MTEVVSSILGPLLQKLASPAVEDFQLVWSVKDDREKLKNTLEMIQKVLADAEQKQTKEEAVRLWLLKLEDFCYDAEDVLDEFESRALWWRARSTFKRKVCYLSSWLSNFSFQFKMADKMKELGKRLDRINEEKIKFNLLSDVHEMPIVLQRETHSFVPTSKVIGRNVEKKKIIELLMGSDDGNVGKIGVIPIIGMGGSGKTTLAKLVYNDDEVKKHFDCLVWLSMPVEFQVTEIIIDIIKSLGHKEEYDKLDMLRNCLRSMVENKRCLFVMDDVWEVTEDAWRELTESLEGVSEGSKVIVTSRNKSVASIMGTVPPLKLANLSKEDSLTLFVKCAFDQGQEKNHPDLMVIGEEIVNKCKGNPLAVTTLGCSLHSRNNRKEWEYVRDSNMWRLKTNILPSLRISYDLMPSYLKQCFAYCSIFPRKYEFANIELIHLWISNGFIQSSGNNQELQEKGRQYLEELRSRSFFNVVWEAYPLLCIGMHDLIYELAISVAQPESSNIRAWTRDISWRTRYISFPNPSGVPKDEVSGCLSKVSRVRTIVCWGLGSSDSEFFLETCISQFKHLRVLWLQDSSFHLLPRSIGRLKHLRYLSLNGNSYIKKLPKSVCELYNLHTLILGGCNELEELPTSIKHMISLRFLWVTTKQQHFLKSGIGCLTSLWWLGIAECKNLEALFDDIQSLTSLRTLLIVDCPKLTSLPQGIKNLKALEDLLILDCESLRLPESESNGPRSMSRLQTFRFQGLPGLISLPGWLEGSASTLQRIRITYCPKLSALPEWLQNCSSLRTLEIESCPELSSLPDGIRLIPTLTKLRISNCEKVSSCGEDSEVHSGED
ncbi:putative disease resistance protein RGA1 [Eucalyptus grandis]|uniref:putative disease resistance protein RGA1 n=1 Tax=Eucalyptus grandis TaxID=71139 RepID=UPI00192EBE51|nr:putative disease resistance protein RGA1 [Eucalyptus grandis]